ncbi:MAG: histidine kinase [Lachnospiraceae bacterium]|nr:histidine kinase [Lachnospiraceae bacterium]
MKRLRPVQLKRIEQRWQAMTIRQKITAYTVTVFLCIFLSVVFNIWVAKFSLGDFNNILNESSKSSAFVQAIENESRLFELYIKNSTTENRRMLNQAMEETQAALQALPFDYEEIGQIRYAQTWSVRNCYEVYVEKRDIMLRTPEESRSYVDRLYEVYDIQEYLRSYAAQLMDDTLAEGSEVYRNKISSMIFIPFIIAVCSVIILLWMTELSAIMKRTIVTPVMKLVEFAKRIANNDFFIEDVQIDNHDEIGELAHAFNKMKYATGEYILGLEERRKTLDLLYAEELEKLEAERRLEAMKLEVLKNQVNPHFLFNTLNVIGGMAMLENAKTTEKMIMALSNLFRYNLKNPNPEAILSQELNVVKDYMYIQQMRFGERLSYSVKCELDENTVLIPTFTFQPLVENAIIHGLAPKEEGGRINVRLWETESEILITFHDTGVGMSKEKLENLKKRLADGMINGDSIGVGNVYRRFKIMYPEGRFEIYSRETKGTLIKIRIPKEMPVLAG